MLNKHSPAHIPIISNALPSYKLGRASKHDTSALAERGFSDAVPRRNVKRIKNEKRGGRCLHLPHSPTNSNHLSSRRYLAKAGNHLDRIFNLKPLSLFDFTFEIYSAFPHILLKAFNLFFISFKLLITHTFKFTIAAIFAVITLASFAWHTKSTINTPSGPFVTGSLALVNDVINPLMLNNIMLRKRKGIFAKAILEIEYDLRIF